MVTAQEFSQIMLEPVFAIPNAARRLSSPQNGIPILLFGFKRGFHSVAQIFSSGMADCHVLIIHSQRPENSLHWHSQKTRNDNQRQTQKTH